ncbi:hypothetical protein ABIE41_001742 [Bosea sp. OAE506]|uniref:hypothetical protein n=1 Tax=Bosea sp. OAE506 TaxID=2663870 RepID=UPI00178B7254
MPCLNFATCLTLVRRAALACLVSVLFAGPAPAQEARPLAGTGIALVPPPGFEPASGFAGLVNPLTQGSVLVAELPAEAHPQIAVLFADVEAAKAGFARQNVTILRREEVRPATGETVPLLSGTQALAGVTYDKWVALLKGPKTVMLTIQSPQAAKLAPETVRAMVASVSFGKQPTLEEKLTALPFAIAAVAPFRILDTIGGSGVMMTAGERDIDPSGRQPLLIAVYQLSAPASLASAPQAAETALRATRDFQAARIDRRESTAFAGGEGVVLGGTIDAGGGRPRRFVQYFATGPEGRFVRLLAVAEDAAFAGLTPGIEQVAASVAFRR